MENKITLNNISRVESQLNLTVWKFLSNASNEVPCRIFIGWNTLAYNLTCIHSSHYTGHLQCFSLSLLSQRLKVSWLLFFGKEFPYPLKIAWSAVCYHLLERGLGIKSLQSWNEACITILLWRILTHKDSIWTSWVYCTLLRGKSIWQVQIPSTASWSWRKILQSREWCQGKMQSSVGNGKSISLWHGYWLP